MFLQLNKALIEIMIVQGDTNDKQMILIQKKFSINHHANITFIIINLATQIMSSQVGWQIKRDFPYALKHKPAKGIRGSSSPHFSINVFTQFDPLKQVILGYIDQTASLNEDVLHPKQVQTFQSGKIPEEIVKGGAQYLQNFSAKLQQLGVSVLRVGEVDFSEVFEVGGMKTHGFFCFSARDIPFVYHDSFFEFPSATISRSQEFKAFEWIEEQLYAKGSRIYAGWPSVNKYKNYRYRVPELYQSYKSEDQYFGDAANLLKLGLDIIFLISEAGSMGLWKMFSKMMLDRYGSKVRVHPVINVYKDFHIDTTFTVMGFNKKLGKYLVLAQGERVNPTKMPALFRGQNWAVIQFVDFKPEHTDPRIPGATPSIGLNFMVVNPHLAIISHRQTQLKRVLEFYGIQVIPIQHKYARPLTGGMHCSSNDVYREDVHGFSKIIEKPTEELTLEERAGLFDPKLLQLLEKSGEIQNWPQICNQHGIFPNYITDHLSEELKNELRTKHQKVIQQYKSNISK